MNTTGLGTRRGDDPPESTGSAPHPDAPVMRAPRASEAAAIQAVWEVSHHADEPAGRPRGGWSVHAWPTETCALVLGERIVGVAAIRAEAPPTDVVEARLALDLDSRHDPLPGMLLAAAIDLARAAGGSVLRVTVPEQAEWATSAVRAAGFQPVRTIYHMLLRADVPVPEPPAIEGLRIRSMRDGEEAAVLEALNRAWVGTWGFQPIPAEMLERDLEGQRDGMLLGVDAVHDTLILGTCHALFDPSERNPYGDPQAWISNLTVAPEARGRGIGRALLVAGLAFLRRRGAASITLSVDADNPAPLRLYQSVGFVAVETLEAWDKALER